MSFSPVTRESVVSGVASANLMRSQLTMMAMAVQACEIDHAVLHLRRVFIGGEAREALRQPWRIRVSQNATLAKVAEEEPMSWGTRSLPHAEAVMPEATGLQGDSPNGHPGQARGNSNRAVQERIQMSLGILNNIASIYAQNNLNQTQSSLQNTLSSCLRVRASTAARTMRPVLRWRMVCRRT